MNNLALGLSLGFVGLAAIVSKYQELGLEKDLAVGVIRTIIQLTAIGYILAYIFASQHVIYILLMLTMMVSVAAINAAKRGKGIPGAQWIVLIGIGVSEGITLFMLLGLKIIPAIYYSAFGNDYRE